jgi:hypothetical protein
MRRWGAAFAGLVSACSPLGAKLVTVPMQETAPPLPRLAQDDDATPHEDEAAFTGTWEGRALKSGDTYPLTVTFEHPHGTEVTAHVYYADQRCRGDWKLHASERGHWQGEEAVTVDPFRRCPDHARVTLEVLDEDTINWRWARGSDKATATLERSQQ